MKHTSYSTLSTAVEASVASIRAKEITDGRSQFDAVSFTHGIMKALLCESLLMLPAHKQALILQSLERMGK